MDLFVEDTQPKWKDILPEMASKTGKDLSWLEPKEYEAVLNLDALVELCDYLKDKPLIAIDTETTGLLYQDDVVGIVLSAEVDTAYYLPLRHELVQNLELSWINEYLVPVLMDGSHTLLMWNAKFDIVTLEKPNSGLDFKFFTKSRSKPDVPVVDVQIMVKLTDPDKPASLKWCAKTYVGMEMLDLKEMFMKGKSRAKKLDIDFSILPLDKILAYAPADADSTLTLYLKYKDKNPMTDFIVRLEHSITWVLIHMKHKGLRCNLELLKKATESCNRTVEAALERIHAEAGADFKPNSPKDLGNHLYEVMKLPVVEFTKGGAPSTAKAVLELYSNQYPFVRDILSYRESTKLRSAFLEKLPTYCDDHDDLRPSFNQLGTASGRFSCTDPNLQQLPKQRGSDLDFRSDIRRAIVPRQGYILLSPDYSQVEYRVFASMCGDKGLQQAYHDGLDFHAYTAASMFGVPLEAVTKELRQKGKTLNFGLLFGMSPFGLSQQLNCSEAEARELFAAYFEDKPRVAEWSDEVKENAVKKGSIKTHFGRRRMLREVFAKNTSIKNKGLRKAINSTVQGTAADILKLAMVRAYKSIEKYNLDAHILATVHDELLFEVKIEDVKNCIEKLQAAMELTVEGFVPLVVDVEIGWNWADVVAVDEWDFDTMMPKGSTKKAPVFEEPAPKFEVLTIEFPAGFPQLKFAAFKSILKAAPGETSFQMLLNGAPKQAKSKITVSNELLKSLRDMGLIVHVPENLINSLI